MVPLTLLNLVLAFAAGFLTFFIELKQWAILKILT
jgi:hypothetical protein